MERCPVCHSSRWVREVVTLEYLDGNGEVVLIENRVEVSVPKCVTCSYAGKPEQVPQEAE
jgi:hypothetical protein